MVLCDECTAVKSYIFRFGKQFLIFCDGSVSTVFKCLPVYSLAPDFKHVAQKIVTAVCFATQTQQISVSRIFVEESGSFLSCFFVFSTTRLGEKLSASVWSERFFTVFAA